MTAWDDLLSDDHDYDQPAPDLPAAEVEALTDADRHLRSLRRANREKATIEHVYRLERERLEARYQDQVRRVDARIAWHTDPLRQLHARLLDADPRRKTIRLPNGDLVARKKPPVIRYDDTETFLSWAQEHRPDWVQWTPRPVKQAVKQATASNDGLVVTGDGEVVPGVAYEPESVTYDVKLDEEVDG